VFFSKQSQQYSLLITEQGLEMLYRHHVGNILFQADS